MSRFCSSGETYAKVAEAKKAHVNNSLAQQRTSQWWTSEDEVAFLAHLQVSGYDSEDDEEDNKKNKRQQSLDPPKKRESTSSNKNRSKSLDPGSRNSKCYLGIPRICVTMGRDGCGFRHGISSADD